MDNPSLNKTAYPTTFIFNPFRFKLEIFIPNVVNTLNKQNLVKIPAKREEKHRAVR